MATYKYKTRSAAQIIIFNQYYIVEQSPQNWEMQKNITGTMNKDVWQMEVQTIVKVVLRLSKWVKHCTYTLTAG